MAAKQKAAIGGLLRGLGRGTVENAQRIREDGLLRAQQLREEQRRSDDRAFQLSRDETSRSFQRERDETTAARQTERDTAQRGLLHATTVTEGGGVAGITRGGETIDLGIRARTTTSESEDGMSAGDKRLWDMAKERHTTESIEGDRVDWGAVAADLRQQGHADLAQLATSAGGPVTLDIQSDEWRRAEEMAEEWIGEQTSFFKTRGSEFPKHGGDLVQARLDKTREFYDQLTGQSTSSDLSGGTGSDRTTTTTKKYGSAEEVGQAYQNGELSYTEAQQILREQFGME